MAPKKKAAAPKAKAAPARPTLDEACQILLQNEAAVFRVATYAALLARQPTSNWSKGALGGRVRAALAAGRRAPAGHVELAEVEVGRDSPAGARAEKVEHV